MRTTLSLLLFVLAAIPATAADPSTPEDRQKLIHFTRLLEENPFGEAADERRSWATRFIDEAPDIKVKIDKRGNPSSSMDRAAHSQGEM